MHKENILIICNEPDFLKKLNPLNLSKYKKIVVASDNPKVHKICKELNFIDNVVFLQKDISYVTVAHHVVDIINKINIFLKEITKLNIFTEDEAFFTYHVEGGLNQDIQDLLLYLKSLTDTIIQNEIKIVIIVDNYNKIIKSSLNILSKNLNFKIIDRYYSILSLRFFKKDFLKQIRILNFFYRLIKTIAIKTFSYNYNFDTISKQDIVFMELSSSEAKHIDNFVFLLNAFKVNNLYPLICSWGVYLRKNQSPYQVLSLEKYLKYNEVINLIQKYILLCKNKNFLYNIYLKKYANYFSIENKYDLSEFVYQKILDYLLVEAGQNYLLKSALKNLLSENGIRIKVLLANSSYAIQKSTVIANSIGNGVLKFMGYWHNKRLPPYGFLLCTTLIYLIQINHHTGYGAIMMKKSQLN